MLGFNHSLGFFTFSKFKEKRNFAALKIILTSIFTLVSYALFGLAYVNAAGLASNALPTNGQVVSGQAAISQSGNVMNINQSTQKAVINWSSFNVGSNATVNFNQPNANASTLNRVNGASKSMIDGALNSNGQIIFVNPNGVIFGKGAEVNTGGITATTMDIRDSDYMNGKMSYSGNGTGRVVNKGNITVNSISGYIALMAPEVKNEGVLMASLSGSNAIALVSGKEVTLSFNNNQLISITVDASAINSLIVNKRLIKTDGGQVIIAANSASDLRSSVINNSGIVSADSFSNVGGKVFLTAATVNQAATISANSENNSGGQVVISGKQLNLNTDSKTTATGATGGGQILIGKTNLDTSKSKLDANVVTVAQGALVDASATQSGNGGSISIWSQISTSVAGIFKATGGAIAGNGGTIDTSSAKAVAYGASLVVDTTAPRGKIGNWITDPLSITIDSAAATVLSNALSTSNVTLDATLSSCGAIGSCSNSATPLIQFLTGTSVYSSAATVLTLNAAGGTINMDGSIAVGQVYAVAQTINVNGSLSSTGGSNSIIYLAGSVINILGSIRANGSSSSNTGSLVSDANVIVRRQVASNNTVENTINADTNSYTSNAGLINIIANGDINIGNSNNTNAAITANGMNGGTINIVSTGGNINHYGVIDALGKGGSGGLITIAAANNNTILGGLISVDGLNQGGLIGIGLINTNGSGSILAPPAHAPPAIIAILDNAINDIHPFVSSNTTLDSSSVITANAAGSNAEVRSQFSNAGKIFIAGQNTLNTAANILANADNGGLIILSSPTGTYQNTGYIQTNGGAGLGGTIAQSGLISTILIGANEQANGVLGGGNIIVGRDFHANPLIGSAAQSAFLPILSSVVIVPTSQLTVVDSKSELSVNAIALGNGGNALLWGNALAVYGTLSANGGILGGNGGLLETSGNFLDSNGISVSAVSNGGFAGTWLIDPFDVYITTSDSGTAFTATGLTYTYTPTIQSNITAASITTALNAGTSVTITTGAAGSNTIFVQSAINGTNANASLTLTAGTINISANITTVGAQTFNGNVLISADATLTALGITSSTNFNNPAVTSSYTVPAGVSSIRLTLVGGAGGSGGFDTRFGNHTGVSGLYTFTVAVTPGQVLKISPGSGGIHGMNQVANWGGGAGGTNALGIGSGGQGAAAGPVGNSGAGGGGGAASVVQLYDNTGLVLIATFYGAGAGGGAGANNVLDSTAPGLGGSTPGLDAGQYQLASSTGMSGTTPNVAGGFADGGGNGGGGGGLLGGLSPPSTIQSFYDPGTGPKKSLLGCIFCNAPILSLNGLDENIGQGGNRGSNGYKVESGKNVSLSNTIDSTFSWGSIANSWIPPDGSNGFISLAIPSATGITINGTVNSLLGSNNSLTISSGGSVSITGNIGSTTPLSALTITSSAISLPTSVISIGPQSYNGAVVLGVNTSISTTSNGAIIFNGTVDSLASQSLTINTGLSSSAGAVTFSNLVGSINPVGGISVFAGNISSQNITSSSGIELHSSGSTNAITLSGLINNTGSAGTGILAEAVGNLLLSGVSNSGSLGMKLTGGYGVAAGTIAGGDILDLGTVTNTGGNVAISMAKPTTGVVSAGSAGSPEFAIGLTNANSALATNVTYNQAGGSYVQPSNFIAGSGYGYVNYRQNSTLSISVSLLNDYQAVYGQFYNSNTALAWLRNVGNSNVIVNGAGFGFGGNLSTAQALSSLTFANSIGGANNSNNVQNATALNTGTILSNTGNAVTMTGAKTYTITPATASLAATKVYDSNSNFIASTFTASGINGETLNVSNPGAAANVGSNVNPGTYSFTSLGGLALGNGIGGTIGLASNYQLPTALAVNGTITGTPPQSSSATIIPQNVDQLASILDSNITLALYTFKNWEEGWGFSKDIILRQANICNFNELLGRACSGL